MNVPDDLRYAESHEWIRVDGDVGTVGITDHAQAELTDIVYAEPPKPGTVLKAADTAAVVESVKAASDIYSPVSGEVVESNSALESDPALLNQDPFGAAWFFRVRLADPAEVDSLMDVEAYRKYVAGLEA